MLTNYTTTTQRARRETDTVVVRPIQNWNRRKQREQNFGEVLSERRGHLSRVAGDDRSVVAAEAEPVAHYGPQLALARCVRRVVQIAIRIGRGVIDCRRAD